MEILLICDIKYVFFTDSVQFNFKLWIPRQTNMKINTCVLAYIDGCDCCSTCRFNYMKKQTIIILPLTEANFM
jgi:hypothetical protein